MDSSNARNPTQSGKNRRNWVIGSILFAAAVVFVAYRWRSSGFDVRAFASTFVGVNWLWLAASIPVILATYLGRALRWRVMILPICPHPSLWRIFAATAIGFTAIVFFGRAGELVRPYLIATKEKVTFSSQVAAWLLERILDLLMVLFIFGVALAQISSSGVALGPKMKIILQLGGTVIGVTAAVSLGVILLFRYFTDEAQRRVMDALAFLPERYRYRLESFLGAFRQGMESTRRGGTLVTLLLYSVLEWMLIVACYACLLKGFPATQHLTITDIVIFMGFVSFGAAIQIPGVGGGIQVASIFMFTEFFHLSLEVATGMALVLWAVTFVVIVPVGVALAFREGIQWKALSHISEEVEK